MSPPMQSSFQSCIISEESYCAPWDLKAQEEKLKLLNEQHHISSLTDTLLDPSDINNQSSFNHNNTNAPFHRSYSARAPSKKQISTHRVPSPSVLHSLSSRGLISSRQYCANNNTGNKNSIIKHSDPTFKRLSSCFNSHTIRSGTATSRSFLFASIPPQNINPTVANKDDTQSISYETTSLRYKCLSSSIDNNSLSKTSTVYDQPWDILQTSFLNTHRHGRSLQKLPNTEEIKRHYLSPTFPIVSSHHPSEEMTIVPIDCYFWYHYTMSRRQAEDILQSRTIGSFLVRQSESGNQHDYSLSIKTIKGCMHMRICYSEGFYILGECSRPFSSVACMIDYFSQTSVPVRGAAHIKLGTPVLRCELSSSSLSNEELL